MWDKIKEETIMKITFKKLAAVLSAAAIAVTVSGCSDNGYIMTVGDMQIRNGVYLSLQQTSISNANNKLSEDSSSDSSSSDTDSTEQMIDGKTFSEWVKEDTLKGVKRFVGIQHYCNEFGISLSDEERSDLNKAVQEEWDSSDYYLQIMGFNTIGDYYESYGIGIESLKEMGLVNLLNDKLFMHYYGEGGERDVPDEEVDAYMEENNAAYKLMTFAYQDYNGDPVVDDEKQEIIDRAKSYAERYNNGEKYIDILYDFDLKTAQDKARKEAESSYSEDNANGLSKEDYVKKAVDEAKAEKGDSDDNYDEVIAKDSNIFTEELMGFLFDAPTDAKAYVYEGTTSAYLLIRKPVLQLAGWRDINLEDTLKVMKNDEYNSMMDLLCQNFKVEQNDYLVNNKYSPEKMNK